MVISFKLIRKIGKMLRGGAGKKEIFLGALLGVLIGFNPVAGLTLSLMILIALLLNANLGFTLLGVALGKVLSLILSIASFHVGFFIIHKIGLEGVFAKLINAPITALMDLDVYAMVGSLPFSIIIGIIFGKFMTATVTKIREQMVKAAEHEKINKAVGNKFSKFLIWLAFGKQKISTADVLEKQSPLIRKSGIIFVAIVLILGLLMEFLLVDVFLKKGIESSIASSTGAEVNVEKAHFSMSSGKLEIENLQVTDRDKPSHNVIQIDTLAADLSMTDLLRRSYIIDLLSGSTLKHDIERASPGVVYVKEEKKAEPKTTEEKEGKSLDEYLAQAAKWKKYGEKAQKYLEKYLENAKAHQKNEAPKPSKEKAIAEAQKKGYLKAKANLVTDRPAWTIRKLEIANVHIGRDFPIQRLEGTELSSRPEINMQPSTLSLIPQNATEPTAKIVLRFDDTSAMHELIANIKNVEIGDSIKAGDALKIEGGKADIALDGTFSITALDMPFKLSIRDLKTDNKTLNSLKELELPGKLYGTLIAPRVKIDLDDQLKDAVVDAAKNKAKDEAKKAANKEINKALESDEAQELKNKLKSFF